MISPVPPFKKSSVSPSAAAMAAAQNSALSLADGDDEASRGDFPRVA